MTGHVYLSVFGFAVLARGYFKVLVIGYDINKLHSKIQYNKLALHAYLWVKTEPKMSLPCTITMFSALLPACSEAAP